MTNSSITGSKLDEMMRIDSKKGNLNADENSTVDIKDLKKVESWNSDQTELLL